MTQTAVIREIERESKRNAWIRSRRRQKEETEELPEVLRRMKAHLERRRESPTRNRWYALSCETAKAVAFASAKDRDALAEGLRDVRDRIRKERCFKYKVRERA